MIITIIYIMSNIYVLELLDNKYYIGKTNDPETRIN